MTLDDRESPAPAPGAPTPGRKPYQAPALRVYGSLARITESVTNMGMLDGGMVVGMRRSA